MDNVEVKRFCTLSLIQSIAANLQNRTSRRTSMKCDSIKKKKVAFDDQCLVHCFIDHRNKNVHKYEKRTNIQSSFEMLTQSIKKVHFRSFLTISFTAKIQNNRNIRQKITRQIDFLHYYLPSDSSNSKEIRGIPFAQLECKQT